MPEDRFARALSERSSAGRSVDSSEFYEARRKARATFDDEDAAAMAEALVRIFNALPDADRREVSTGEARHGWSDGSETPPHPVLLRAIRLSSFDGPTPERGGVATGDFQATPRERQTPICSVRR